jgi:threonyl-tRNA synthetase
MEGITMIIKLKDGSIKEYDSPTTAAEIAKDISMGLYRNACCVLVDGKVKDLRTVIDSDCSFEVLTFDDEDGKKAFNHTASHVMAQAVKRLYPNAKLTIGPSIENGFYYDFDIDTHFTQDDLDKIEKEMKAIIKENYPIEKFELPVDEAVKLMEEKNEPYKIELIKEHAAKGEHISFYKQGEFTELCAGPHLMEMKVIKAFKLTNCTGAYWRGDADNKMLCRVYGIAFPKASMLEDYLNMLEEAKKRDHNKLGRELELFTTVDYIGQGLPILLPKGTKIIQILQRFVEDEEARRGWQLTKTPLMAKSDLYKISGHWDHYKEGMFVLGDEEKDKEVFALRPMTCPFQYQAYLNKARSYRDLPLRYDETSTLFRNEASGEMHGLIRVRQFTISEGHLMCTPDQLEDEFRSCLELATFMLKTLGLYEDASFRFSKWDPNDREKYIGTEEQWDEAQSKMKNILDDLGIDYKVGIGEAAFYGPKLDIQIRNVYGKEDTLITIQIDQMLAEKFGMEYVDKDGTKKNPYIIHRTSIGCYERTLAYLIEKYAGAFPTWLAPVQVKLLPIADRHLDYLYDVKKALEAKGIRCEIDDRSEKIGFKIRQAQLEKVPYMLLAGDKDIENNTVSLRTRSGGDKGAMSLDEFVDKLLKEVDDKSLELTM